MKEAITHRRINAGLTIVTVFLGLYIALAPFLPVLELWVSKLIDSTDGYVYQSSLADSANIDNASHLVAPPEENTLLIPSIQLDELILEGGNISVIEDGSVWLRPRTSTPDKGGNTVIVGHRWSYSDPATFYHLNKMEVGERFAVFWDDEEYIYEVFDISVVPPTALEIEAQTDQPILTLYTCTPLWTASDRLVVKSRLIRQTEEAL